MSNLVKCPKCKNITADYFSPNFYTCKPCDSGSAVTGQAPEPDDDEPTNPQINLKPWFFVGNNTLANPGKVQVVSVKGGSGMTIAAARYRCTKCGDEEYYSVDSVACGLGCSCGGDLRAATFVPTP